MHLIPDTRRLRFFAQKHEFPNVSPQWCKRLKLFLFKTRCLEKSEKPQIWYGSSFSSQFLGFFFLSETRKSDGVLSPKLRGLMYLATVMRRGARDV